MDLNNGKRNTIGERINKFDEIEYPTVADFNSLFPECPLKFEEDDDVYILEPAPNGARLITVGGDLITHKMYSDVLYNVDRQDINEDDELYEINGVPV